MSRKIAHPGGRARAPPSVLKKIAGGFFRALDTGSGRVGRIRRAGARYYKHPDERLQPTLMSSSDSAPPPAAFTAVRPGVFLRHDPPVEPAPVLVDVSRSGREYPPDFRSPLPFTEVHDNVSMYVEELCGGAPGIGATLLFACFPNTYIDTNRSASDIDESLIDGKWPGPITQSDFTQRGLGLLKRLSRYGTQMQERKLAVEEVQERLRVYHEPYHHELARLLAAFRNTFGAAWQMSFHCMSAVGAPTHADPGKDRADFCVGDVHGKTCDREFLDLVVETLQGRGHTVSVNFPYFGGELTLRHSNPADRVNSIFIEINKRMFIDTKTFKRTEGFSAVRQSVDELLARVVAYSRSRTQLK
jgi:N-formylglutamate deformylase